MPPASGGSASEVVVQEILSKGLLLPKGLLWREKRVQDDIYLKIFRIFLRERRVRHGNKKS